MKWIRRIPFLTVLILLAVLVFQNQRAFGMPVEFAFLKWSFSLVLGFWILFAFAAGVALFALFDAWRGMLLRLEIRRRDHAISALEKRLADSGKGSAGAPPRSGNRPRNMMRGFSGFFFSPATRRVPPLLALIAAIPFLAPSIAAAAPAAESRPGIADSVRREAGKLAAEGRMEEALVLVEKHAPNLPAVWNAMFAGKLELEGEASSRGYAGATADSAPEQMRGEAVFRLGQYHYAAERHHLAIPQFRLYLARHPDGAWSEESAYWMAHSCLRFVGQRPDRAAYLDTALAYLRVLEAKGRASYYWPLARAARARVQLLRGDTAEAVRALRDARASAPSEETPGVLLLSLQAEPFSPEASAWEDSLRWNYPLAPETQSLARARREGSGPSAVPVAPPRENPVPVQTPVPGRAGHALQLGAFSQRENAERLQRELAGKKITARVEPVRAADRTLYRVLTGDYPDAGIAQREGKRLLAPLGYEFRVVEQGERR